MTGPARPRAMIVGAGIGGLAAAVALRRSGWDVRVFERAAAARELGFGLVLAPNAMAALDELGLAEDVAAQAVLAEHVEIRRTDGQVLRRFHPSAGAAQQGWQTMVVLRSVLHGRLLDAAGRESIELGREAVDFETDLEASPGLTLRFADGHTDRGAILIGADGARSIIRQRMHPLEPLPRPSGFCSVRGVAYDVQAGLSGLTVVGYLGPGIEAATVRAGENAVYWYLSMLTADVPGDVPDAKRLVAERTAGFDPAFRAIADATRSADLRFDRLLERRPLATWGAGRATLLGDAAHPMLPHTGQGAAQALEDAVALGLALNNRGDIRGALRRYERVRAARTRRIVKMGPRMARVSTTRSRVIGGLRDAAVRIVPGAAVTIASRIGLRDPHRQLRRPPG